MTRGLFEEVTFKLDLNDEKDPTRHKTMSTQGRQSLTRRTLFKLRAPVFYLSVQEIDFASNCERVLLISLHVMAVF